MLKQQWIVLAISAMMITPFGVMSTTEAASSKGHAYSAVSNARKFTVFDSSEYRITVQPIVKSSRYTGSPSMRMAYVYETHKGNHYGVVTNYVIGPGSKFPNKQYRYKICHYVIRVDCTKKRFKEFQQDYYDEHRKLIRTYHRNVDTMGADGAPIKPGSVEEKIYGQLCGRRA